MSLSGLRLGIKVAYGGIRDNFYADTLSLAILDCVLRELACFLDIISVFLKHLQNVILKQFN